MEATLTICEDCSYPHQGASCENPACYSNPAISSSVKDAWRVRDAALVAEREQREYLDRCRAQSFDGSWRMTARP